MSISDDLGRWLSAGLIDADTAAKITAYEAGRSDSKSGRGIEAVAYLGAVLVLVALATLAVEFWDRLEPLGQLAVSLLVAGVLFTTGLIMGSAKGSAMARAQSFAWLLATIAMWFAGHVVFGEMVSFDDEVAFLYASSVALAVAFALWRARPSVLQMTAMGLTTGLTAVSALVLIDDISERSFGIVFAALGVLWLVLTYVGYFRPRRTSLALGATGLLLIAFPELGDMPWTAMGLVVALIMMIISVALDENVLLGFGVAGMFVYTPLTVFELFGDTIGVPVALLTTGLVLLGVVVLVLRRRAGDDSPAALEVPDLED